MIASRQQAVLLVSQSVSSPLSLSPALMHVHGAARSDDPNAPPIISPLFFADPNPFQVLDLDEDPIIPPAPFPHLHCLRAM
jgi:hypothetical protein